MFITKKIDANVAFRFNFTKIVFQHRKFNSIIVKIVNKLLIFLRNSFWMYFYWINMLYMTTKKALLIVIFDAD